MDSEQVRRNKEKARRIASLSKPKFLEIPRLDRFTACEHNRKQHMKRIEERVSNLLYQELMRLWKEW